MYIPDKSLGAMNRRNLLLHIGIRQKSLRSEFRRVGMTIPNVLLPLLLLRPQCHLCLLSAFRIDSGAKDVGSMGGESAERSGDVRSFIIRQYVLQEGDRRREDVPPGSKFEADRFASLMRFVSTQRGSSRLILICSEKSSTRTC